MGYRAERELLTSRTELPVQDSGVGTMLKCPEPPVALPPPVYVAAGGHFQARRRWQRALAAHSLILLFGLLALAPFMDLHTSWVADEGAYALAVHDLRHGTWQYDYVGTKIDPIGKWFPVDNGDMQAGPTGLRYYAYLKHPLDVVIPWLSVSVFGSGLGYHLPSLLGALLTAVAAWLLTAEFNRRAAPLAFWLAAISPMAVNAYLLWSHALSAGVAGITLWAAIRCWRSRGDPRWGAATIGGIALGVPLRSEAALFGVAVAVIVGAALAVKGDWRQGGVLAMSGLAAVYGVRHFEQTVVSWIVGHSTGGLSEGVRGTDHSGYIAGRLRGAGHDLLAGSEYTQRAHHLMAVALVLVAIAGLILRTRYRYRYYIVAPVLVTVLWLYHIRFVGNPLEATTGLLAAWPVLLLALMCLRRPSLLSVQSSLIGVVGLFALMVVATDYAVGGGLEWGGRFFSPALVPLAALAADSLVGAFKGLPRPGFMVGAAVVAGLAVLPAALGLDMLRLYRTDKDLFYNELVTRSSSLVVIDGVQLIELPRGAWRLDPKVHFLFTTGDVEASDALSRLHAAGVREVTLLKRQGDPTMTGAPYPHAVDVTGPVFLRDTWQLLRLSD